jgi:peptide/nickel transport system permease protein
VIQSIPGLLLVFFAAVISGFNVYEEMIMVGIILIPETANGVYERVAKFRERDFVEAARELGMSDRAILWNEIVWHNVRRFLLTRVTQAFTFAVLVEVTLSFIGLADATTARLGVMMKTARDVTETPVRALAPIAALLLIMATFSLMERGVGGLWERRR